MTFRTILCTAVSKWNATRFRFERGGLLLALMLLASSLAFTSPAGAQANVTRVELRRGLVITSSVRIIPRVYNLPESAVNYAPIAPGVHNVRVEYVQVEGWTELRVDVVKGSPRGTGTLGPH